MEVLLALGTAALTDAALRPSHDAVNAGVREVCARAAAVLGATADVDVDHLHALIDGLALHLVRRTRGTDPAWAVLVLDAYLSARPNAGGDP